MPGRVEEVWTEVDGRPVRSVSTGEPHDLPEVVLVPGMGAPGYLYPWMQQVGSWTRATVLDLPGWHHGRGRSCSSTVAAVGTTAARWLEATDRRGVVLVGHSSGSQSALRTARAVPDRLVGLVLADPTLDPLARHPVVLMVRLLQSLVRATLVEVPAVLPWWTRSGGVAWLRLAVSAIEDQPEDLLPALRTPLLVVTGEHDRLAPPAWAAQLAAAASARCVVLPGAHNACFTRPDAADLALHAAVLRWAGARPPRPG